ncbi:MAG: peptidoglycan D,D-transpeptidase FtsI family protein, partial [Methyloligellaceae bacterium]
NRALAGVERYIDKQSGPVSAFPKGDEKRPPVRLAMDLSVQYAVREELANAMQRYQAKAAAGIVLDVHTGEIIALSSLPDYDPNHREQALAKSRFYRASFGVYEMGSVFKVFTTAAALDTGVTSLDKGYDARKPIKISSFTINDSHAKRRWLSVPEIFIYSSNIGSAKMALDMGVERHKAFLGKLGLLERMETEMGPTAAPIMPKKWGRLNSMTISYGHGLSVTPLHVASAAAALVNGGYKMKPAFLARSRQEAHVRSERVLKLQTSDLMRYLFRLNVLQGTGKRASSAGYRVGGKTGTAEKVVNGRYSRTALFNSFLGVFPMDAPEYLVLVVLDEPKRTKGTEGTATAGVNAGPTVGRIIERIGPMLDVTPVIDKRRDRYNAPVPASY